ncbi:helix-turn-helix domain-containing protein [Pseudotabrizicola algicola]|uniref:Helix-turn-helix transcriptional regulator n=1 Tax=Pseudotabrizicola algicola TaxID=2709381 RepID=A0A6B3RML3_9RHOB|nr:helix-turn-helix transcriptional regulator [Pseudotabrizicola algicola]NEX45505.1 helix-turn-helix transcriptional regulator [Pseudotabrizicola algicola]
MTRRPSPNPADLRMILGDNLRQLCQNTTSISELCRTIGVNRTQFNRYLSGTAFPRPDILFRICRHFGVDANILLQRLDRLPTAPVAEAQPTGRLVIDTQRPFDHYLLPDGIYRYWRKSFRQPEKAYCGLARIYRKGSEKLWKGYDVHDVAIRSGTKRHARSTCYEGQLIQQFDGFALMSRTPYNDQMNVTYFEYGLDEMPDYFSGISFVTRRRLAAASRLTAIVMQRLGDSCPLRLAAARGCGTQPIESLPPHIRGALDRVPDRL